MVNPQDEKWASLRGLASLGLILALSRTAVQPTVCRRVQAPERVSQTSALSRESWSLSGCTE